MKHIPTELVEEIVRRLVQGLHPEKIILFGSHAYGQPTSASDLDIMIIVSESTAPPHRRDQQAYSCLRGLQIPIDLLVLTQEEFARQATVVTSLARRVKEKGKLLYDRREMRGDSAVAIEKLA